MLSTGINEKFLIHLPAEAIFGKHSFHCPFNDNFRTAFHQTFRSFFLTSTGVTAVCVVNFLFLFVASKYDLFTVDHNDIITCINMGSVRSFVFAAKHGGDLCAHATYSLISTVYNVPLALYGSCVRMFCCKM